MEEKRNIWRGDNVMNLFFRVTCFLAGFALLITAGVGKVSAQLSHSVTIKASAQVIEQSEIELVTIKDLDLDLNRAVDGLITVTAKTDMEAGKMVVKGKPGAYIRVTYMPEMELVNTLGQGSIKVHYEVAGYPEDNQIASEPIDAVERMMRINTEGMYYLWVGGQIEVAGAQPGNYQGEFTIEIEYI